MVGVVIRIVRQYLVPAPFHKSALALEAGKLIWGKIRNPACRLVMIKLGIGRPDDQMAALAKAQAQIDVVEGDREVGLVEPADLLIGRFVHHQTSAGYRA